MNQLVLSTEEHEKRKSFLRSIEFLSSLIRFRERELNELYKRNSPQLDLFSGLET